VRISWLVVAIGLAAGCQSASEMAQPPASMDLPLELLALQAGELIKDRIWPCPGGGHVTVAGKWEERADGTAGGSLKIDFSDPTNNLNDCVTKTGLILDGTIYLTFTGNAYYPRWNIDGTVGVNRRGEGGGLVPIEECRIFLGLLQGGQVSGSICGESWPPGGGGGGADGGAGSDRWDGQYSADVHTETPLGPTDGTGTFSCSGGQCSDPGGTFVGTVDAAGNFDGTTIVCQGCDPLAMSGVFSLTMEFRISGVDGSVSQTIDARKL